MSFKMKGEFVSLNDQREYMYTEYLEQFHRAENGQFKTAALVYEAPSNDKSDCVFTLKDQDYINQDGVYLFSLQRLYLAISDPTEYEFALEVFGSWRAWQDLKECKWMKTHVTQWVELLEIKMRSEALVGLQRTARGQSNSAITAQKFLAEKGWDKSSKRGRPTKEELERTKRIAAGIEEEIGDDYDLVQSAKAY